MRKVFYFGAMSLLPAWPVLFEHSRKFEPDHPTNLSMLPRESYIMPRVPSLARAAWIGLTLVSAVSLHSQVLFQDDFNGSISGSWSVLNSNASYYTVGGSSLALTANSGNLAATDNTALNIFRVANPTAGDFVVTMALTSFVPVSQAYAQINVLAFDDMDNHVRAAYLYNGSTRIIELSKDAGASFTVHGSTSVDFGSSPFYLRLTKIGNLYTQSYSTDGSIFTPLSGSMAYGDGTPTYLGFIALADPSQSSIANIDSFTIAAIPEQSTWAALFGSVAMGLALLLRSRFFAAAKTSSHP